MQVNGQKYSITDKDKKIVKQRAKEVYAGQKVDKHIQITVEQAIQSYIELKTPVLSPSTILGYSRYKDNCLRKIANINTELSFRNREHLPKIPAQNRGWTKVLANIQFIFGKRPIQSFACWE